MKIIFLFLSIVLCFSCQKIADSSQAPEGVSQGPQAEVQNGQKAGGKTFLFEEILLQELSLSESLNWGSAESFQATYKKFDDSEVKATKLSYFFQESKLVQSKDIDKLKNYCELSTIVVLNENGSEISLISKDKLFRFAFSSRTKEEKNNLDYQASVSFKLSFQNTKKVVDTLTPPRFELECFNVWNLAELKSVIEGKFTLTKTEEQ